MSTIFTKIINGEIPCYKVEESTDFLAFLDIMPLQRGHVLVVPKTEVDYIFDLDDDILNGMMLFAKQVALKMRESINCSRIGMAVIGLEVPHAHIHLIPINKMDDMNFANPKIQLSNSELDEIARSIQKGDKIY